MISKVHIRPCNFFYYRTILQIYTPPFLHASIRQNRGEGLCVGSWYFCVVIITDQQLPCGREISVFLLAVWWRKLEKNNKVSLIWHIAVVLKAIAFTLARFHSQSRTGGGYSWDKNICAGTLAETGGGLYARRGIFMGHYGSTCIITFSRKYNDVTY